MSYIYKNFDDYDMTEFKTCINPCYLGNSIDVLPDAPFKYCNIINTISKLNITINTLLEPGCAYCSLCGVLCKKNDIKECYLFDYDVVSGNDILNTQQNIFDINNIKTKIIFKGGDFFSRINEVPDNSIDVVIDGCSLTHFYGKDGIKCWNNAATILYTKLKKNGYIIISSDVKHSENIEESSGAINDEFIYPNDIINIFEKNGYKLCFTPIISNNRIEYQGTLSLCVAHLCFKK